MAGTARTGRAAIPMARTEQRQHRTDGALARSYLANERVGRNYDDMAPGLSRYIHDAIMANADRASS
ncbi:hypothetical protein GCM10010160_53770 [Acrocarpospora corrugata]